MLVLAYTSKFFPINKEIFGFLNVLPNLPFTTSERCEIITYKRDIYELPDELPNDLRLRILGNYEISGKCLNPIGS